jgi:hypothetical protein
MVAVRLQRSRDAESAPSSWPVPSTPQRFNETSEKGWWMSKRQGLVDKTEIQGPAWSCEYPRDNDKLLCIINRVFPSCHDRGLGVGSIKKIPTRVPQGLLFTSGLTSSAAVIGCILRGCGSASFLGCSCLEDGQLEWATTTIATFQVHNLDHVGHSHSTNDSSCLTTKGD